MMVTYGIDFSWQIFRFFPALKGYVALFFFPPFKMALLRLADSDAWQHTVFSTILTASLIVHGAWCKAQEALHWQWHTQTSH